MTRFNLHAALATIRRTAWLPVLMTAVLSAAPGCVGEDSQPPAARTTDGGAGSGSSSSGDAAGAADGPMSGREVSRSGQLEGIWMRITTGDLLGLEFLGDGSAIVTPDRSGAMASVSMRFRVLPNGRVALETAGGTTTIYNAVRDGDVLELTPETTGRPASGQRFQRLPRGVTLAEGLREARQRLDDERASRLEALGRQLTGEDLVLVPAEANSDRWLAAVRVGDGGGVRLIVVAQPERPGPLSPIRVHRGTLAITPVDSVSSGLRLEIRVGGSEEPVESNDPGGSITLLAEGPVAASVLLGSAAIDLGRGGPVAARLVTDAALAREAERRLAAQRAAERAAIVQMAEAIGGRIELRGER